MRNPFARQTRIDAVRKQAEDALGSLQQAVDAVQQQTERVLDGLPEPRRGNHVALAGAVAAGAAGAAAIGLRRLIGADAAEPGNPATSAPTSPTGTAPLGPTEERLNDPALKAKVESELFQEDDAAAERKGRISIDVADGVVTLRGELDDAAEITSIGESVTLIDGVRRVENLLHQPGQEPVTVSSG